MKNKVKVIVGTPETEKYRGLYTHNYDEMELTGEEILQHITEGHPVYTKEAYKHPDSVKY